VYDEVQGQGNANANGNLGGTGYMDVPGNPMYDGADDGLYDEVDVVGTGGVEGYMEVAPGQQQDDSSDDEAQEDF